MCNSLTIVIPNRNRDLKTVRRSLDSIVPQLTLATRLVIVDYGSSLPYQLELEKLVNSIDQVESILCPTQGQLWNKSRCINIVLKTCTTSHFMVSDMDMIWHPQFLKNELDFFSLNESVYYTVGVMTEEESKLDKPFEELAVKFQTNDEATGITVFPTEHLTFINGFDEFYHGWGSEDTDAHVRLKNAGYVVRFREGEVLFKHQWHAKAYRSKQSTSPFHPNLERINQSYLLLTQKLKKVKANDDGLWGEICDDIDYKKLNNPSVCLKKYATEQDILAIVFALKTLDSKKVIKIQISNHPESRSIRNTVKKALGKKTPNFISLDRANNILIEAIIMNHHNRAYSYSFSAQKEIIKLSLQS